MDICYLCYGNKKHGDEDAYVTRDAEGKVRIKRCWRRMSDQSKHLPGPKSASKHLMRIQALTDTFKESNPDKAACFATLTKLIQEKALVRGSD